MKKIVLQRTKIRKERILRKLKVMQPCTINQVIDCLHTDDLYKRGERQLILLGWRYYVHLNKLFSPMEKDGIIKFTGKFNENGEKIWRIK